VPLAARADYTKAQPFINKGHQLNYRYKHLMDMKRIIMLILLLLPFISGCKKQNDADSFSKAREAAWNSLSVQEKGTIIGDWKQAPVTEATYQEKSTYAVTFNTSDDALLGPIIVYVDRSTLVVLGKGLRL
jgi:hypothetical protein